MAMKESRRATAQVRVASRPSSARRARPRSACGSISTDAVSTRSRPGIAVLRPHARVLRAARPLRPRLEAKGDLQVDLHHTVEDVGIALGQAFREALGTAEGIRRYGSCLLPMAEAKVEVAVDVSNRPYLVYQRRARERPDRRLRRVADRGLPVRLLPERRARSARRAALRQEPAPRGRGGLQGRRPRPARGRRDRSARDGASDGEGGPVAAMRPRIALVDYGAGNLRSVAKALERSELDAGRDLGPEGVRRADGVAAARRRRLPRRGLRDSRMPVSPTRSGR